jgi:hypothetical protein
VRVQILLAAELTAFETCESERLRALEHYGDHDLLRGRGLAYMATVTRGRVIAVGKRDETHLTFGGHEGSLVLSDVTQ